ncbi:hypothetical protein EGW08_023042 [Elysia chlorotica]|uniref:Pilin n=1 Tax=Elysia chlorotica TaxID=188477 RepID=A0A3S1B0W5_ELYCH|nr:hypothetical protein EGW08_023042 [Elysia chlorotica]
MVVIAIIAILAAVAIPMYSNYTARAKIGTELAKLGGVKADVAQAIADTGAVSGTPAITAAAAGAAGMPAGTSVSAAGVITVTGAATDLPSGGSITLTPTLGSGAITWACGATGIAQSQLPSNCTAA